MTESCFPVDGENLKPSHHEVNPRRRALDVHHHSLCRRRLDPKRPSDLVPPPIGDLNLTAVDPLGVHAECDVDVLRGAQCADDADPRRHLVGYVELDRLRDGLGGPHPRLRAVGDVDVAAVKRLARAEGVARHGRKHARCAGCDDSELAGSKREPAA